MFAMKKSQIAGLFDFSLFPELLWRKSFKLHTSWFISASQLFSSKTLSLFPPSVKRNDDELLRSSIANHALCPLHIAVRILHGRWLQRRGEDCSYANQIFVIGREQLRFMGAERRLLLLGQGHMQQQQASVGSQPREFLFTRTKSWKYCWMCCIILARWILESKFDDIFFVSRASGAEFFWECCLYSKLWRYVTSSTLFVTLLFQNFVPRSFFFFHKDTPQLFKDWLSFGISTLAITLWLGIIY